MGVEILIAAGIAALVSAGTYAVSYAIAGSPPRQHTDDARQVDPRVQGSRYGVMIPRIYGTVEMAGQVIWASGILDTPTNIPGSPGSKGHPATPDQTHHHYSRSFAVMFCAGPVAGILKIKADDKTYYASSTMGEVNNGKVHIYTGSETQMPDSWIEADKGVGKVSAHRGYVVVVFKDFPIDEYGDRIPNIRAEIVQAVTPTLSSVVAAECALAGLTSADITTTGLGTDVVRGYFVNQQGPVRQSLEQLSRAFLFDGTEYDGKLNFRKRPQTTKVVVPWDDLGAVEGEEDADEEEPTPRLSLKRKQSAEIARIVDVIYYDSARNYEEGTQSFTRQNFNSQETLSLGLNVVMTPTEASRLAKIIAVTGWSERIPVEISLPTDYMVYAPGDVFTIPLSGVAGAKTKDIRVEKMTFAAPGVVRIEGVEQFEEAYQQTGDGSAGLTPPSTIGIIDPCVTQMWISDRSPFRAIDQGTAGHYIGVGPGPDCDPDEGGSWTGTSILREVATELVAHALLTSAATMGEAETVLAAHAAGLDTTNTVRVHLSQPVASVSNAAFEADHSLNLFAIGEETLQARDVTDLGGGDYLLAYLRRGMFNSPTSGHAIGEDAVLLNHAIKRVTHNDDSIGQTYDFYPVTFGRTLAATTPRSFTLGGKGLEDGGDVPTEPEEVETQDINGLRYLKWEPPAENNKTIKNYKLTIYTDAARTTPLSGYDGLPVVGNQFALPASESPLYYSVRAVNRLGLGAEATGQFTQSAAARMSSARLPYRTISAATTATLDDQVIFGTQTVSVFLPTAVGNGGKVYEMKNIASGAIRMTIKPFGTSATGRLTFAANPTNGATLPALNGLTGIVFKSLSGGYPEIQIGATLSDTLSNLVAVLSSLNTIPRVTFTHNATQLIITAEPGTAGNAYTLGANTANITRSGATLTGGTTQLIDGFESWELAARDRVRLMSDGTGWQTIGT